MEPDRHLRHCSGSRFAPALVHIGDKEDIQALTPSPEPRNHAALLPRARPRRGLCLRFGHSLPPAVSWTRGTRGAAGALPGVGRIEDWMALQTGTFCAVGDIPVPPGTLDAVGDRIPVPERVPCPRPGRHAPSRVECPRRAARRRYRAPTSRLRACLLTSIAPAPGPTATSPPAVPVSMLRWRVLRPRPAPGPSPSWCTASPSAGGPGAMSSPPWHRPGTAWRPSTCAASADRTDRRRAMTW